MIVREARRERYIIIDANTAEDATISNGARGLLVYLLSKPDNWTIRRDQLAKSLQDGMYSIRSQLAELETAGYITRERISTERGTFEWVMTVHERPAPAEQRTSHPKKKKEKQEDTIGRKTIGDKSANGSTIGRKTIGGKPTNITNKQLTSNQLTTTTEREREHRPQQAQPARSPFLEKPPAVQLYKRLTGLDPVSIQENAIGVKVGSDPASLSLWQSVIETWVCRGYRPDNVDRMLAWYKEGIPSFGNGNGSSNQNGKGKPAEIPNTHKWDNYTGPMTDIDLSFEPEF